MRTVIRNGVVFDPAAGTHLGERTLVVEDGVVVEVAEGAVGGDADVEVAQVTDHPHEFLGVLDAFGMLLPLAERIAGRIAAQYEDVADPTIGVGTDHGAKLFGAV